MPKLQIIQHINVTPKELDEIIHVKSKAWPYTYEKQIEWINQHLQDTDLHVLLLEDNIPVAYLNLGEIEIIIDNEKNKALGVGNVCAIEKRKGYGKELLKQTNKFMLKEKRIGLLFCKKELVNFYKKHSWVLLDKNQLSLPFNSQNIETMIFNVSDTPSSILYKGKPF
ncbi:hypothetical protein [Sunxiuqinia sp. sy24]|uniref:hypothetical protein n=1 Tax=Sunxiuqinia sp. sy24 TaxID=3461495 RepID=UPI0040460765